MGERDRYWNSAHLLLKPCIVGESITEVQVRLGLAWPRSCGDRGLSLVKDLGLNLVLILVVGKALTGLLGRHQWLLDS